MGFLSLASASTFRRGRHSAPNQLHQGGSVPSTESLAVFLARLDQISRPSALLGMAWWSAGLPAWSQAVNTAIPASVEPVLESIKQQAPQALNAAATKAAAPAVQAAGSRLLDSYELCKIGRLGQTELSFLTVFILIGCFIFFLQVDHRLIRHGWEIRKALSETSELSFVPDGANSRPLLNQKGEAINVRVMEPSVSRLIALCGLIMLILFYFGFGIISIYHFGRTCEMPGDIQGVTTFLYAGMTFFAPYLVSKFASIFGKPGRRLPLPGAQPEAPSGTPEASVEPARVGAASTPPAQNARSNGSFSAADTPLAAAFSGNAATSGLGSAATQPLESPREAAAQSAVAVASTQPAPPAPAPPSAAPKHVEGVALIKEFEGFRDQAYPDPATGGDPWTIGYGFTRVDNKPVVRGQAMSKSAADQLLAQMLAAMAGRYATKIPYWNEMHDKQQSCLLSFGWNLGENFYGDESGFRTITQCLRNKEWQKVPEALLLYCMPGSSVHEGLLRRRKAEADLWEEGMASRGSSASSSKPAIATGSPPRPIAAGASTNGSQSPAIGNPAQPAPIAVAATTAVAHPNPLEVEYFDQMLMTDGEGWRECFSASCGMLARYWGKINDQNEYNHIRQQYGDSTDNNAQLKALQSLGLKASFHTNGTAAMLKSEIDAGRPVAVGWLHHGPVSAPSGGGHWTVVIGYDATGFWMNDPYGSCDLANGGYPGGGNPNDQLGKREHYSTTNWLPRWMPAGSPGWFLTCAP